MNPLWLALLQPDEIADLFATPVSAEDLYSEVIAAWEFVRQSPPCGLDAGFLHPLLSDRRHPHQSRPGQHGGVSSETCAPFLDNEMWWIWCAACPGK